MTTVTTHDDDLLTIDELAGSTGLTVRTTRYYASLGLLPPPIRRGRLAYYGPEHRARLELVTAMQSHGYTLAAIEKHLAAVELDASAEEIELQGSLLKAWAPAQWEELDRPALEERAGRRLTDADIDWLVGSGSIVAKDDGGGYRAVPFLDLALQLQATGFPLKTLVDANQAVRRHMDALVEDLHQLLTADLLAELRAAGEDDVETSKLERTLVTLRRLSQESIVLGYQRAQRSLMRKQLSVPEVDA
jgi:DNA-binding transcriptional MerR regulator